MYVSGSLSGKEALTRKFRIGATVIAGQLVVGKGTIGEVGTPNVNTYYSAVGVTFEAGTYAVASPGVFVKCSYSPDQLIRGLVSGGVTVDTAFTSSQLVTQDTSSTTVFTDTALDQMDYAGGYLISLSGASKGDIRVITSHVDSTSNTVTIPFSAAIGIGGTALRTYGFGLCGIELTTNLAQFNNLLVTTETTNTIAIGPSAIYDVIVDGVRCSQESKIQITTPTAPVVEFEVVLLDHIFRYQA